MRRRSARGMTLVEAMVAVVVMSTAIAAIFGMINHVQGANQTLAFQNIALDAFAQISAQIRDARCDYPAATPGINAVGTDAGLMAGEGGWFGLGGPEPGSGITFVGDPSNNPILANYGTPIRIEYRSTRQQTAGVDTSYLVEVRIREITRDPARDNPALTDGHWIRVFPVEKVCTARVDAVGRGEYQ